MPVKLARLYITIGCCFDSHPLIDSVPQKSGFSCGLLENARAGSARPILAALPLVDRLSADP
ncbi:MAG: hypothetical protein ACK5GN_09380 [Pseudomonadota bacterium]